VLSILSLLAVAVAVERLLVVVEREVIEQMLQEQLQVVVVLPKRLLLSPLELLTR
jgi:hypothetical protein